MQGFGANPGALHMLAYVPPTRPPAAALVVVLHGCTQGAGGHASAAGWLTLADRYGFAVLAPEQDPANNPNRCFNWFEPGDTTRGSGEAASIRSMIAHAILQEGLDPARVFVTGLSAGGAMTAVMLATYPNVFAGGAVVAGVPFGVARTVQDAFGLMHAPPDLTAAELARLVLNAAPGMGPPPRIAIWHGDADLTVSPRNATLLARQWAAAQGLPADPDTVEGVGGRTRSVWRGPDGEAMVETNLVRGLGHGTPLASRGADGVGKPAPFMIEAGVSSSLEIARFWGLAPAGAIQPEAEPAALPPHGQAAATVGEAVMAALAEHVPAKVQATIAQALKSAGLIR